MDKVRYIETACMFAAGFFCGVSTGAGVLFCLPALLLIYGWVSFYALRWLWGL